MKFTRKVLADVNKKLLVNVNKKTLGEIDYYAEICNR